MPHGGAHGAEGGDTREGWRYGYRRYRNNRELADLAAGWQDDIEDWMGQGAGIYEVMAKLRISDDTYKRWMKDEPEFKETIEHGLVLSRAWWEHVGRCNLANPKFRENTFKFFMAMRFKVVTDDLGKAVGARKPEGGALANPETSDDILQDLYSGGEGNPLPAPST